MRLHQPKDITVPHAPDVDALPWTQAVVSEALQFCPQAYHIHRDAAQADDISGIPVSVGDTVGISPFLFTAILQTWLDPARSRPATGSCPAARPPVRDMRISRSAAVAASAWARVWPSWSDRPGARRGVPFGDPRWCRGTSQFGGPHDRSGHGQSVRNIDAEQVEPAASALTQARAGCWIRCISPQGDAELDQAARTHLRNQRPILWSIRRRF